MNEIVIDGLRRQNLSLQTDKEQFKIHIYNLQQDL